jgi:Protein of unknown function (DUF4240)
MSGFEYHVRCGSCGLTSPVMSLAPDLLDRELGLPAADRKAGDFTVITVRPRKDVPLAQLAAQHSDGTRTVAVARLRDDEIALEPPLTCPRCGATVTEGRLGGPPPAAFPLTSVKEVVQKTRRLPPRGDYQFSSPDGYRVECMDDAEEDGRRVNRWYLRRRGGSDIDLQPIAGALIAELERAGSRCADLELHTRGGSFNEWPPGEKKMEEEFTPDALTPQFWKIIDAAKGDDEKLRPILEKLSKDELYEFYRQYEEARQAFHDDPFYGPEMSDDDVDDIAMWVIGQGEARFRDVLAHPKKMPRELPSDDGVGFNSVASRVYEDRFGQNLNELFYDERDDDED